jgi:DNA (cytosine-5)-methyltransferase 1
VRKHKYPYEWTLKDATFTKDKGKVFSCFACGGGSTMGYKLAGFDVIGCNEIDPKMMECYIANHSPKHSYLEPIQTFKLRDDLPDELYNLDILDGSPPCSNFSMAGKREKDWGKKKKFREGQAEQVLDTLFFDFIDLAKKLQPKIVIAENVKGLLVGEAKSYVKRIISAFIDAGYRVDYKLLDASKMGVPQRRERVFFYAVRRDIQCETIDLFGEQPYLDLGFNEREIVFNAIEDINDFTIKNNTKCSSFWTETLCGKAFSTIHPTGSFFNDYKTHPNKPVKTITADNNHGGWHYKIKRLLNYKELIKAGSFPKDYNYLTNKTKYLIGMSVPPVMVAQIASRVYEQWLK